MFIYAKNITQGSYRRTPRYPQVAAKPHLSLTGLAPLTANMFGRLPGNIFGNPLKKRRGKQQGEVSDL